LLQHMAAPTLLQQNFNESYCIERGVLTATTTYYRVSLLITLVVSIMSAISMINFIIRCHKGSLPFHNNLRILYFFLCVCCFSYDVFNIVAKIHHLTVSLLSDTPCQIFMPKYLFMAISLPLFCSINAAQFAQMAIIAERLVAIIFVRNYESGFKRLGPALLVTAIAANICTINFMYYGENFNAPQWNARTLPSTTLPRSSLALLVMLIMNFISLIVTISLYFFSRSHKGRTTLSSRFQSNENASVSNLLFLSSSLQFSTLFLLQMFNLYMRTYQIGNPLQTAYRENFDLFNFYTLILPILSTIYFIKVKRRRVRDIAIKINMKAKGNEGWTNYSIMIQRQWK
uniref:Serpentine receptor class gamma n=1 Tax=Haemonchus contortus TaxID=6289 RepID=A0A7I4YMX3_HAECO